MRYSPRRLAAALATLLVLAFLYLSFDFNTNDHRGQRVFGSGHSSPTLSARQDEVEAAFQHAWDGYSQYCMGHDTLHPVTNTCDDDFGGWGASAVDALTTAIMFEKEDVVLQILRFISTLDFTVVAGGTSIQLFEVTIRHFGSMVSAYDLLQGPYFHIAQDQGLRKQLYSQMIALGSALTCGFSTPTGIPRNWVDPTLCKTDNGRSNSVAGVGTMILEFARLSDITGLRMYVEKARKAEQYLIQPQPESMMPFPGILGSFVAVKDGQLQDKKGSWGSLADSFYEYLLKAYIYDQKSYAPYLERWKLAADSTIQYIASHAYGHPEWTFLPYWEGAKLFNAMDSLSWFAGGNFILGGMITGNQTLVDFGISIANTGGAMYEMTATGLGGEYVTWTTDCDRKFEADFRLETCNASNSVQVSDPEFKLRPEVMESWYYAYRATKDPKYREWAWSAFQAINRVCRTDSGFSAISDVNAVDGGDKLDQMESFVFAEVMKYIWLIHLDDEVPFHVHDSRTGKKNDWVYNTEAHPLRVAGEPI